MQNIFLVLNKSIVCRGPVAECPDLTLIDGMHF